SASISLAAIGDEYARTLALQSEHQSRKEVSMMFANASRELIRRTLFSFSLLAMSAVMLIASQPRAVGQNGQSPLIDRELFFGDPEISGGQISPDGKFISFIKPFKGTRNIWVKRTEDPFTSAKPITADTTRPIPSYFWSRDGKYILFAQ